MPRPEHIDAIERRLWSAADYESLRGVLPKAEYQALSNDVLGQLLRTLNPTSCSARPTA